MSNITKRVISSALEEVLGIEKKILDHGFIRVIDYMGIDSSVVQAARVSYGEGTKKVSEDKGLINYLMKHRHTTPFEMCEIKFHIKLPIFVARQWLRHRTANVNEYSARYSILSKEFYLPKKENISLQSSTNKQGREADSISDDQASWVLNLLKNDAQQCYDHYLEMINENVDGGDSLNSDFTGIARELARMNLPVSFYTQFYWKIDLHNLLHFLSLRADSHAQYEIREYANYMLKIVEKWVPNVYEAFMNHRLYSKTFSANQIDVLKRIVNGEKISKENSGLRPREWKELCTCIDYKE